MDYGPYGFFDGLYRYQNATAPRNTGQMGNNFAGNMLGQGINTMNNLGSTIGNAFGQAAALSSQNYQAGMPLEIERLRQQGQNQRLQSMAPLLAGIFGGGGGSSPRDITTNYGAGVSYGPATKPAPTPGRQYTASKIRYNPGGKAQ